MKRYPYGKTSACYILSPPQLLRLLRYIYSNTQSGMTYKNAISLNRFKPDNKHQNTICASSTFIKHLYTNCYYRQLKIIVTARICRTFRRLALTLGFFHFSAIVVRVYLFCALSKISTTFISK